MRKTRIIILVTLGLVFGLALAAQADTCQTYSNHSGFVPASYDYAIFIENGVQYGPFDAPINYSPSNAYEGNNSWDQVRKCNGSPTTTSTSSTTTTQPTTTTTAPTTTTTAPTTTTTQPDSSSTTTPSETTTTVTDTTTSAPSATTTTTGTPRYDCTLDGELIVLYPGDPGYDTAFPDPDAVDPDCAVNVPITTTTVQTTDTLPFTGPRDFGWYALVGVVLSVLGVLMVRGRYGEE